MAASPELSVVMSVYNGQTYLPESIESVLKQSYTNFEFIIINDGSTDNTGQIIEKYLAKDKRIIAIHHQNKGLARSLNKGIKLARGKLIARQDDDDVSLPERFESQIELFKNNPDLVLCGTWFLEINEGHGSMVRKYPVNDWKLRENLKYVNYFCHPSVIFKKKSILQSRSI